MREFQAVVKEKTPAVERAPEIKFAVKADLPARFHRIATITDGKQTMKLKIYAESRAPDVQEAIRVRFGLESQQRLVLTDAEDCDVVIDGTLETGNYKLQVL